jgi:hypothetical protein
MFRGKEEDGGMTVMAAHNDSVINFGLFVLMALWYTFQKHEKTVLSRLHIIYYYILL